MSVSRRTTALLVMLTSAFVAACADQATNPEPQVRVARQFSEGSAGPQLLANASGDAAAFLIRLNGQLAAQGAGYAVRQADLSLAASADPNMASTVIANDRTHRLGYRFVPGDPRRATVGAVVRQASFLPFSFAPTPAGPSVFTKPSVDASFATWNGVKCSKLDIFNNALPSNVFPSAIIVLGGFTNNPMASDINTVGFLPGSIFDAVFGPGASGSILGVTFPFVFINPDGSPTDINGDGEDDLAFAEIWYNAAFRWNVTGTGPGIDVETVALHENGHALGLGHFGRISIKDNGQIKASPRAVMNAFILGVLRSPLGTDNGSYCGYWASWPN